MLLTAGKAANPLYYGFEDNIRFGYRRCFYASDTVYYRVGSENVEIMAILGGQGADA